MVYSWQQQNSLGNIVQVFVCRTIIETRFSEKQKVPTSNRVSTHKVYILSITLLGIRLLCFANYQIVRNNSKDALSVNPA